VDQRFAAGVSGQLLPGHVGNAERLGRVRSDWGVWVMVLRLCILVFK
jgi:hypothetical protein